MDEYNFKFNRQDLAVLNQALVNMPYGQVVELINKINQQIIEQENKPV